MLEGGDWTVRTGKDGLKVGERLCGRLACAERGQRQRRLGRRAAAIQGGADLALRLAEPVPDALPGAIAPLAVEGAAGSEDTAGEGNLEEAPKGARGQAEPPDFVGEPDAERPPAPGTCVPVAAEDAPGAQRRPLGVALVESVQKAVPDQRADHLAVRTGRLFDPLRKRRPLLDTAAKPALTHGNRASAENDNSTSPEGREVLAGYDVDLRAGCGVKIQAPRFAEFPV